MPSISAPNSNKKSSLPSTKIVYCLNGAALGDLLAAAPVLKWAIDNCHTTTDYRVALNFHFKELYPFIPEEKFIEINSQYPPGFAIHKLNAAMVPGGVCRLTPARIKLTQYACIGLLGRLLSDDQMKYVPLREVNVGRFEIDFSKSIVIATTYRDKHRSFINNELLHLAEYIQSKGIIPVYVGKTSSDGAQGTSALTDFEYPGFGADLRDKTSLPELATIMNKSKAIISMDSGTLHLAFTTDRPVVGGFTTVDPELRIPYRGVARTVAIVPNIHCNFCQSDWQLDFWDYSKCPRNLETPECIEKMTGSKFIQALHTIGAFR